MLQRVWRCTVDPDRAGEYEDFARHISLPMFRKQQGYRGCIMARRGPDCEVLTLWEDEAAIEAIAISDLYNTTVARIRAAGFIVEELGSTTMTTHEAEIVA
jgi:heme-degrading monooxygenase HmoA